MTPEELMARIDAMSDEQVGALWEHLRRETQRDLTAEAIVYANTLLDAPPQDRFFRLVEWLQERGGHERIVRASG